MFMLILSVLDREDTNLNVQHLMVRFTFFVLDMYHCKY